MISFTYRDIVFIGLMYVGFGAASEFARAFIRGATRNHGITRDDAHEVLAVATYLAERGEDDSRLRSLYAKLSVMLPP